MPNVSEYDNKQDWMKACVPKMMDDKGMDNDQAVAACMSMWKDKSKAAKANGMSLEDKKMMLHEAFEQIANPAYAEQQPMMMPYVMETYDKYIIVCMGHDEYYQVNYSMDADGKVTLAPREEWKQVVEKWTAKSAVKAVGDWLIEITAVPFGIDSDRQRFGTFTDYMTDTFSRPAILYHHGIKAGMTGFEDHPIVIGSPVEKPRVGNDAVFIKAKLNSESPEAGKVWEAAKNGKAVASSDSITHLARLKLNDGRTIMYEKDRPGDVMVWPLAGVSLWDSVKGNLRPASQRAIALPAMKAIYRDAGLAFPDIDVNYGGFEQTINEKIVSRNRTRIQRQAQAYLFTLDDNE